MHYDSFTAFKQHEGNAIWLQIPSREYPSTVKFLVGNNWVVVRAVPLSPSHSPHALCVKGMLWESWWWSRALLCQLSIGIGAIKKAEFTGHGGLDGSGYMEVLPSKSFAEIRCGLLWPHEGCLSLFHVKCIGGLNLGSHHHYYRHSFVTNLSRVVWGQRACRLNHLLGWSCNAWAKAHWRNSIGMLHCSCPCHICPVNKQT